jgi:hypothetical protein
VVDRRNKVSVSAKAVFEFHDVIRVWIEFRAPQKGELMWTVPADASIEEALEHVVVGRDLMTENEAGFGCRAYGDQPEFEYDEEDDLHQRNIVVHVEIVRTEPQLNNILPHVKLL